MNIPIEFIDHILTALVGAGGGWLVAHVNARSTAEQKLTEATDSRLKILIHGYETRTQSLLKQLDASERRIDTLTRQYEQRIESLTVQIEDYQKRVATLLAELDQHGEMP